MRNDTSHRLTEAKMLLVLDTRNGFCKMMLNFGVS